MSYMTEERRLIQETAREFAMREVLPIANKLDPLQEDMPMSLRDKMAEMGYFGIIMPEEYGGMGLGCFEYCLITEELARAWMSVASIIARGNGMIGWTAMTDEQKKMYLPKIARGEMVGAFAMSEPNTGSDIASLSCRARNGVFEPTARARERESFGEHQPLDEEDLIDVGLPIQARAVVRFLDADAGELLLPGAQHVRLHLGEVAHLLSPKQLRRHRRQYIRALSGAASAPGCGWECPGSRRPRAAD